MVASAMDNAAATAVIAGKRVPAPAPTIHRAKPFCCIVPCGGPVVALAVNDAATRAVITCGPLPAPIAPKGAANHFRSRCAPRGSVVALAMNNATLSTCLTCGSVITPSAAVLQAIHLCCWSTCGGVAVVALALHDATKTAISATLRLCLCMPSPDLPRLSLDLTPDLVQVQHRCFLTGDPLEHGRAGNSAVSGCSPATCL
mmetsp:Transcript_38763/g.111943  ORF Transcript_38763/g.111943 Transcript_38763/m.111943 type:complete len:201 (+) Transcript_38763:385-987(+)